MSLLLDGQTAVVTGGASGIGRATAKRFAEEGSDVIIADVREDPRLEDVPTHELIESQTDSRARYVECDVTRIDNIRDAVEAADEFGGIDTMVNNAGVNGPMGPFHEATVEEYRDTMAVVLDGVFYGSKVAAAKMLEDGTEGAIVNMSSAAAMEAYGGIAPYSGAKGGVQSLTHGMAADVGPEIRVNAVHPGLTETAMASRDSNMVGTKIEDQMLDDTPLDRLGQPEDIANAVVFLASDLAGFVSGASLLVDGGLTNTA